MAALPGRTLPVPAALRFGRFLATLGVSGSGAASRSSVEIQLLQQRDPEAWQDFFLQQMPAIYQYVASRVASVSEAEDVTSEVFEAAWAKAGRLQDRGLPARAWLFGIARNVVNGHRRSWFRRPQPFALNDDLPGAPSPGGDDHVLADAIARLPSAHAEVINLRFIQGLSLQEAADVLATSVDAIKGRQARALLALREALS